jgi:dTDP-4-dehydrorhamnose reductase
MIWLIGNIGMLGTDVESTLKAAGLRYCASDMDVDICDIEQLRVFTQGKSIRWVVNCAAYTAVDQAEDDADAAFRVNAEGVKNIATVARETDATLIHISTDYVFSGDREGEYRETDPTGPTGTYGKSKLEGEKIIAEILDKFFIIRIAWLYGAHGKNFVYTMLRLFNERDEVRVVSDQWGSPTWSKDVADVIVRIITDSSDKYGIYHYTNDGRINWYEFACEIYRLGKEYGIVSRDVNIVPIRTVEYPTKAKRPENSYLSKEKIINEMGIAIPEWKNSLKEFISIISNK